MEKLIQVLRQDDTVIFVGSGVSRWSGLPSWAELIENLARHLEEHNSDATAVRAEASRDLLQAASYGFDQLTPHQAGDFIRKACQYGVAQPHEIHRKIVRLGPRCFITTNYDNLLEEALRMWRPERFFRAPVTNRHLTETAEIVHARAIDFIFKPHGDAGDSASIVLTRKQYRQLLPGGEWHAAMEALKTLLTSRPVVYLGFSLRDPDFIYLRDILENTYKGGIRDHYAIMPDVSMQEVNYWRKNYGIHLISYQTAERTDKSTDHTPLLALLDHLISSTDAKAAARRFVPDSAEVVLALARYAAARARFPEADPEFQVRVTYDPSGRRSRRLGSQPLHTFNMSAVDEFLDAGPTRSVLLGSPGAGKTYSFKRSTARLAEQLHQECLLKSFQVGRAVVPLYVDMKLYRGDIYELLSESLPTQLPLGDVLKSFPARIFVDSFNEMPREYWESGAYESDIGNFVQKIGNAAIVIGSRTRDGLDKLDFPLFHLDIIDEQDVATELRRRKLYLQGRFRSEMQLLLQRPFFFQYVLNGKVRLSDEAHPREFFESYFAGLQSQFTKRFRIKHDLQKSLSVVAFNALNQGEEAFPVAELLKVLKTFLPPDTGAREVANWLVSSSILVPHPRSRITFIHQSVTEYLAAVALTGRYLEAPQTLREKLSLGRWDQALFLTLSLLPEEHAERFFQDVAGADLLLAINAAKYLEWGREEVISRLLAVLLQLQLKLQLQREDFSVHDEWEADEALKNGFDLPVSSVHESALRRVCDGGGVIGAYAVKLLVRLRGAAIREEFIPLLSRHADDTTMCEAIGTAFRPLGRKRDLGKTINTILQQRYEDQEGDELPFGLVNGVAAYLAGMDLDVIRSYFIQRDNALPESLVELLMRILQEHRSFQALEFAADLLLKGVKDTVSTIHFISDYGRNTARWFWDSFSNEHVARLIEEFERSDDRWAVAVLTTLCTARPDLAEVVSQAADSMSKLDRALLLYCARGGAREPIMNALSEIVIARTADITEKQASRLSELELSWTGNKNLFISLIKMRNPLLSDAVLGNSLPPTLPGLEPLGANDIGLLSWWFEYIKEAADWTEGDGDWLAGRIGCLLGTWGTPGVQGQLVEEFNNPASEFRGILHDYVLARISDITIEQFSEDAISYMLAALRTSSEQFPEESVLGQLASERFVNERLLPLLTDADSDLQQNLRSALRAAGSRHRRRYLLGGI